jgi:hypothetical protein
MTPIRFYRAWLFLGFILLQAGTAPSQESLPAEEFTRHVQTLSEEGGYFFSDNFTSNEDSYLTVVEKMKELGATGTTAQ